MSYLHTEFHDNWISSFRGVAMTRLWDGRTDRRTDEVLALLDLLSPSATQVKEALAIFCDRESTQILVCISEKNIRNISARTSQLTSGNMPQYLEKAVFFPEECVPGYG